MKRINFIASGTLSFLAFVFSVFSFTSCVIDFSSSGTKVSAPSIVSDSKGLIISPTTVLGVSYMNIIRYEVENASDSASVVPDTEFCVGQITSVDSSTNRSYQFIDSYVAYGKYYQYSIRYKISSGYQESACSKTVTPKSGLCSCQVTTDDSNPYIGFDDTSYTLTIKDNNSTSHYVNVVTKTYGSTDTTVTVCSLIDKGYYAGNEAGDWIDEINLEVAISNGSITRLFPLTYSSSDYEYVINLVNLLPESFFGVELTVEGITVMETEYVYSSEETEDDTTLEYTNFHWMLPCTSYDLTDPEGATLTDSDGGSIDYFIVETSSNPTPTVDDTDTWSANVSSRVVDFNSSLAED